VGWYSLLAGRALTGPKPTQGYRLCEDGGWPGPGPVFDPVSAAAAAARLKRPVLEEAEAESVNWRAAPDPRLQPPLPSAAKIAARQDDAESINVVEGMLQKSIIGLDEKGRSLLFYAVRGVRNDSGELEPPGGSLDAAHPISRARLLTRLEPGGAARFLVTKKGINPNLRAVACGNMTPLMEAARYGHVAAVKVLLSVKADPSLRDDEGLTALQIAQTQLPAYLTLEEANCSANQWELVKANIQHDRDRVVECLLEHKDKSYSDPRRQV